MIGAVNGSPPPNASGSLSPGGAARSSLARPSNEDSETAQPFKGRPSFQSRLDDLVAGASDNPETKDSDEDETQIEGVALEMDPESGASPGESRQGRKRLETGRAAESDEKQGLAALLFASFSWTQPQPLPVPLGLPQASVGIDTSAPEFEAPPSATMGTESLPGAVRVVAPESGPHIEAVVIGDLLRSIETSAVIHTTTELPAARAAATTPASDGNAATEPADLDTKGSTRLARLLKAAALPELSPHDLPSMIGDEDVAPPAAAPSGDVKPPVESVGPAPDIAPVTPALPPPTETAPQAPPESKAPPANPDPGDRRSRAPQMPAAGQRQQRDHAVAFTARLARTAATDTFESSAQEVPEASTPVVPAIEKADRIGPPRPFEIVQTPGDPISRQPEARTSQPVTDDPAPEATAQPRQPGDHPPKANSVRDQPVPAGEDSQPRSRPAPESLRGEPPVEPSAHPQTPPSAVFHGLEGADSRTVNDRGIREPARPEPAAEARIEQAILPDRAEAARTPTREIAFQLGGAHDNGVEVRLQDRAGRIHVSVRTPDQALTGSLRSGLDDLVNRLEQRGFRAETWTPEPLASASPDSRQSGAGGSEHTPDQSGSGRQRHGQDAQQRQQEQRQRNDRSAQDEWAEEWERQRISGLRPAPARLPHR